MKKVITSICLIVGFGLLLVWPLVTPKGRAEVEKMTDSERREYQRQVTTRMLALACGSVLCLIGAGIGAIWIVRDAKRAYAEASTASMKELISTTQQAIKRAKDRETKPASPIEPPAENLDAPGGDA